MAVKEKQLLEEKYQQAVSCFPGKWQNKLLSIPSEQWANIQEIRLQQGRPFLLVTNEGPINSNDAEIISAEELELCFRHFCGYSVHTHEAEIRQGFVSVNGGHRVGLGGTAVYINGNLSGMRGFTSLNFRISRAIQNAAAPLLEPLFGDGACSVLIVGAPSSGKTTILRDLAWQLSSGGLDKYYKVAVIDERFEIAGNSFETPLGFCCDLLSGFAKAEGILQAVRTLSPEFILCDELGTVAEIEAINGGLNSGVNIITSIHASTLSELKRKPQYKILNKTGAFKKIVLLKGASCPGDIKSVVNISDDDKFY